MSVLELLTRHVKHVSETCVLAALLDLPDRVD
jgi:hypothetical protein